MLQHPVLFTSFGQSLASLAETSCESFGVLTVEYGVHNTTWGIYTAFNEINHDDIKASFVPTI